MAVDYNNMKEEDILASYAGPTWCFPATKSDTNYLTDPSDDAKPIVASAISISREDEDIKVEFWNERVAVIPAGTLLSGVRYKLHIVKLWSTGTGANVKVTIWQGESLRNLVSTSF